MLWRVGGWHVCGTVGGACLILLGDSGGGVGGGGGELLRSLGPLPVEGGVVAALGSLDGGGDSRVGRVAVDIAVNVAERLLRFPFVVKTEETGCGA